MAEYSFAITSVTTTDATVSLSVGASGSFYVICKQGNSTVYEDFFEAGADVEFTIPGLSPGTTYSIAIEEQREGSLGVQYFTTKTEDTPPNPPFTYFDWTYAGMTADGTPVFGTEKQSGLRVYLKAGEWNTLAGLITAVTGQGVTTVQSGDPISASTVNTAAAALGVGQVSKGAAVSAAFFNALRSAYNLLE